MLLPWITVIAAPGTPEVLSCACISWSTNLCSSSWLMVIFAVGVVVCVEVVLVVEVSADAKVRVVMDSKAIIVMAAILRISSGFFAIFRGFSPLRARMASVVLLLVYSWDLS